MRLHNSNPRQRTFVIIMRRTHPHGTKTKYLAAYVILRGLLGLEVERRKSQNILVTIALKVSWSLHCATTFWRKILLHLPTIVGRCPSGDDPSTSDDETVCEGVYTNWLPKNVFQHQVTIKCILGDSTRWYGHRRCGQSLSCRLFEQVYRVRVGLGSGLGL